MTTQGTYESFRSASGAGSPGTSRHVGSGDAGCAGGVVHVVDADEQARRLLARLFLAAGVEARTYEDAGAFLRGDLPDTPSCVVLDAGLLEAAGRGVRAQLELQALGAWPPVVVTAGCADVPTAVGAMKAGAVDFLEKPVRDDALLAAVAAALRLDRERRALRSAQRALQARFETLTRRERQVMALVTAGRMNKQVAGDLGLSEITVKAHRGVVMRKMAARTLADLVRMADGIAVVAELRGELQK